MALDVVTAAVAAAVTMCSTNDLRDDAFRTAVAASELSPSTGLDGDDCNGD